MSALLDQLYDVARVEPEVDKHMGSESEIIMVSLLVSYLKRSKV